jgi:hypothetical protein
MSYSKHRVRRAVRIDFRSSNMELEWKNDELGQLFRWTLRPDVASAEPAGIVRIHLMQRLHTIDARRARPHDWRGWLRLAHQWFNDHVLSSEVMWPTSLHSARAGQLARYQMLSLWTLQTPNFGHSLPMI